MREFFFEQQDKWPMQVLVAGRLLSVRREQSSCSSLGCLTGGFCMSRNLHNLARYSESMFKGDYAAVFDFWAPEFHSHVTSRVVPEQVGTDVRGQEAVFWENAKQAFPDMTFDVNLVLEKDDTVVSNWTLRGTHTGTAFYDVPSSGKPVEINGTAILRFNAEGKIVEHWGGPHCMKGIGLQA